MNIDLRSLSELYREDQRRLCRAEFNAIITLHRVNFEAQRLAAKAESRSRHKESLS